MALYEMQPLIDKAWLRSRESWEQTRLICSYLHKAWFKGTPDLTFPWDNAKKEQAVTKSEADDLMAMMKAEEQKLKNK